jgi:hypothetical protein
MKNKIRNENPIPFITKEDSECALCQAFVKRLPNHDVEHYLGLLFYFNTEGVWIYPNNKEYDMYSIFDQLSEADLVVKQIVPLWIAGSFRGQRIGFMYRKNLQY